MLSKRTHRLTLGRAERGIASRWLLRQLTSLVRVESLYPASFSDLDEVWAVDVVMVDFSQEEPTEFVEAPHGS